MEEDIAAAISSFGVTTVAPEVSFSDEFNDNDTMVRPPPSQ